MEVYDAVLRNDLEGLKERIVRGCSVEGEQGNDDLWSPLRVAVVNGFTECTKLLLEEKAQVDKLDSNGNTALHHCAAHGNQICLKFLVAYKADVNARNIAASAPLHWAAMKGHLACVIMLIRSGAEVDPFDIYHHTPFYYAVRHNKESCAEMLFDAGANMSHVKETDPKFITPSWMNDIFIKRQNVQSSLYTFIGVLRRRYVIRSAGMELIGNHVPKDVSGVLARLVWDTRLDPKWLSGAKEEDDKEKEGGACRIF